MAKASSLVFLGVFLSTPTLLAEGEDGTGASSVDETTEDAGATEESAAEESESEDSASEDSASEDSASEDAASEDSTSEDESADEGADESDAESESDETHPAPGANGDAAAATGAGAPGVEEEEPAPEDDYSWWANPFHPSETSVAEDLSPSRWVSVGPLVGWVHRPSGSEEIRYRPGVAFGGYIRAEFFPFLGVTVHYRQERIPVEVEPGAFDTGDTPDVGFEQDPLKVTNLGVRAEPTWVVHPRLRLRANVGLNWLRFRAATPNASGEDLGGDRAAVEINTVFGGGLSFDIIENWWEVGIDATYGITGNQTGSAYEEQQLVIDGSIQHIAPLPKFQNPTDVIITMGIIL